MRARACKKEFRINGDPREEYLRMPKNPSAICAFFHCRDSRKCDVRFAHDPSTCITYFNRDGEYSIPTAFVLIKTKKNDAGAAERILQALRKSNVVKEAYRISESYTYIPRGYTVMAIIRANTMEELKSFLSWNLKYIIAKRVESNRPLETLIWPPS